MSGPQLPSPAPSPFPGSYQGNNASAADSGPAEQARVRAKIEAQLLSLSQDLYEMEVFAGDVSPNMENAVPERLAKINQALADLSQLAGQLQDSVPRSVIDHVDRYKNPHQYTKTTLSRATGENQYALGRLLGLESFRRQLHDAVSESFPDVPLPERKHRPVQSNDANDEGETMTGVVANGDGGDGGDGSGESKFAVGMGGIQGTESMPGEEDHANASRDVGVGDSGGDRVDDGAEYEPDHGVLSDFSVGADVGLGASTGVGSSHTVGSDDPGGTGNAVKSDDDQVVTAAVNIDGSGGDPTEETEAEAKPYGVGGDPVEEAGIAAEPPVDAEADVKADGAGSPVEVTEAMADVAGQRGLEGAGVGVDGAEATTGDNEDGGLPAAAGTVNGVKTESEE